MEILQSNRDLVKASELRGLLVNARRKLEITCREFWDSSDAAAAAAHLDALAITLTACRQHVKTWRDGQ